MLCCGKWVARVRRLISPRSRWLIGGVAGHDFDARPCALLLMIFHRSCRIIVGLVCMKSPTQYKMPLGLDSQATPFIFSTILWLRNNYLAVSYKKHTEPEDGPGVS